MAVPRFCALNVYVVRSDVELADCRNVIATAASLEAAHNTQNVATMFFII
jgi:folate-binding Fe-S cluster repair protein YgfZ